MLAVILCLGLVAVGVRMPKRTLGDRVRFVFIGLPAKGEVSYTVSILSFATWWLPDERSAIRSGSQPFSRSLLPRPSH